VAGKTLLLASRLSRSSERGMVKTATNRIERRHTRKATPKRWQIAPTKTATSQNSDVTDRHDTLARPRYTRWNCVAYVVGDVNIRIDRVDDVNAVSLQLICSVQQSRHGAPTAYTHRLGGMLIVVATRYKTWLPRMSRLSTLGCQTQWC